MSETKCAPESNHDEPVSEVAEFRPQSPLYPELDGKYHDISPIGSGSQATIVKALDKNNLPVAIKIFDLSTSDEWKNADLFEREIAVLKSLHIKGVPAYIETIKTDNYIFLVEEYIDALSLEKQLDNGRTFTLKESLIIFERTAEIIKELGSCIPPVIHRDIKPDNILVDKDLNVYLIDFGVVANKASTFSMTFAGTAGYVAPEQLYGKATTASDIFSLGATMLHLISGVSPCDMKLDGIEPDVDHYLPKKTPSWLADLLKRMMSVDPAERPQTGAELLQLVQQGQEGKIARSKTQNSFLRTLFSEINFTVCLFLSCITAILGLVVLPATAYGVDKSLVYYVIIFIFLLGFGIPAIYYYYNTKKKYSLYQNKEFADLFLSISEEDLNNDSHSIVAAAQTGDSDAMVQLGLMYQNGEEVKKNPEYAFKLFLNAAAQGAKEGQNQLGCCYHDGIGTVVNKEKALYWFTKAAEQGDTDAQIHMGDMYSSGDGIPKDLDKAIKWYKKAIKSDPVRSMTALGNVYKTEIKDYEQAFKYYSKAVEKGGIDALTNLGLLYENGMGVEKNDMKAFQYYQQASEKGNILATYHLGTMYEEGKGTQKDYAKALSLYQDAAIHDNMYAENQIGLFYENGYGVEKDYKVAIQWYTKSAEHGYAEGQYNLARMYYYGYGVKVNYDAAMRWFRKAADQGYSLAENMLGYMYHDGIGTTQDFALARKWYQRAIEKDHSTAYYNLGTIYKYGQGVKIDLDMARKMFQKAAELGDVDAKDELAELSK